LPPPFTVAVSAATELEESEESAELEEAVAAVELQVVVEAVAAAAAEVLTP